MKQVKNRDFRTGFLLNRLGTNGLETNIVIMEETERNLPGTLDKGEMDTDSTSLF